MNETRLVPLISRHGLDVSARVEVRGIDARAGQRGFYSERLTPAEVIVRSPQGEQVYAIDRGSSGPRPLACIAAPVAALVLMQLIRRKGRR